jgi:hypothetical protein
MKRIFSMRGLCSALILLSALFVVVTAPAWGQQPTFHDELLDHFAGHWRLEGTIAGKKTIHDVDAEWVIEHQYLRFHEVSKEMNPQGLPGYEATVYIGWDGTSSQYACVWLDTYGGLSPVSLGNAKRDGNRLPFLFKEDGPFHTTFTYRPESDSWDWSMDNEDKGVLKPFLRATMTRVK